MNLRKDHYRLVYASLLDEIDKLSGQLGPPTHVGPSVLVVQLVCCSSHMAQAWLIVCRPARLSMASHLVISPLEGLSAIPFVSLYLLSTRTLLSENQIQHYTVDHLAQGSMKNGANSEMPCELQDT